MSCRPQLKRISMQAGPHSSSPWVVGLLPVPPLLLPLKQAGPLLEDLIFIGTNDLDEVLHMRQIHLKCLEHRVVAAKWRMLVGQAAHHAEKMGACTRLSSKACLAHWSEDTGNKEMAPEGADAKLPACIAPEAAALMSGLPGLLLKGPEQPAYLVALGEVAHVGQLLLVHVHQELDGALTDLQRRHVGQEVVPHKEAHEYCIEEQGSTSMLQIKNTLMIARR